MARRSRVSPSLVAVAALYVDPRGPYPTMPGVDAWDAARDAIRYEGPHPVIAHPPCGPWSRLKHLYQGTDQHLAIRAVEQVRHWGGVLEHPAGSGLWAAAGLPAPRQDVPTENGLREYALEVEQVAWGHVARKKTWLYLVGVPVDFVRATIRTGGTPTHWASGGRKHERKGSGGFCPPGIKICSAQQRRRTPPAFAEWLVQIVRATRLDEPG